MHPWQCMRQFYIVTNQQKDKELKLTKEVQAYIEERGGVCTYGLNRVPGPEGYLNLKPSEIPEGMECVICIGGDGTMIRAARDLVETGIPVIGVNRGHVGYLCELDCETVFPAINQLMAGSFVVENRMLLSGYCVKEGQRQQEHLALNDIVIHRAGLLQVVNLIIYVNGQYLNTYSSDGIIIATPTGSTAYSMSAGGPIVDPKAELLLITPICPHGLNSKSIVLGAEDEIVVEIGSRNEDAREETEVSFDGDQSFRLAEGDRIVIRRARPRTRILKLSTLSFLEILRKKINGEG